MDTESIVKRQKREESKNRTALRKEAAAAAIVAEEEAERRRALLREHLSEQPMCSRRSLGPLAASALRGQQLQRRMLLRRRQHLRIQLTT